MLRNPNKPTKLKDIEQESITVYSAQYELCTRMPLQHFVQVVAVTSARHRVVHCSAWSWTTRLASNTYSSCSLDVHAAETKDLTQSLYKSPHENSCTMTQNHNTMSKSCFKLVNRSLTCLGKQHVVLTIKRHNCNLILTAR